MKGAEKEALVHECLVANYEKYYRIAYSYVFQEQDAMDIVQEGAYRAILKSDSLKNPAYVDTWICRIMMNEAVRAVGRKRGRNRGSGSSAGSFEAERGGAQDRGAAVF